MAWMRMMGVDSVAYHRETVLGRADDHPGRALAYYGSRGETPLVWGGSGAAALGLSGPVTNAQYEALFGPGGACDPTTGERLACTRRPGMELVVSAHKSVAELGVIGRADDMHAILDAERDATLAYLDTLVRQRGGRRGRAGVASPTEGLIYAVTRHATSRAGDPNPHDHVLVANVVRMRDHIGGSKAADTTLWREHLHAATMAGRVAASCTARRLGYAIVADDGPSGRLGQWAIAGVPAEVLEIHSKRAAEITAAVEEKGYSSYRARGVAARDNRASKRHQGPGQLLPRWHAELETIGWPVQRLQRAIADARERSRRFVLEPQETAAIVERTLADDGPLARRKVFDRRHVMVAVGPQLFGMAPSEFQTVVARVLADPETLPLVATVARTAARERVYSTATVVAQEQAIAATVEVEASRTDAPAVSPDSIRRAIGELESSRGIALNLAQRSAVTAIAGSGRGIELVVGVAGAGKTTAVSAVRAAFEAEGYEVLGTSTSGQAARTLGREAQLGVSRTLASLTWRLDHGRLSLSNRSVVVLDEAAMADDASMLHLLHGAAAARAKVVAVGDFRQLGAVGPGGGFESVVSRYGAAVHVLADNVRQHDVAERAALAALRDGDVASSVAWYADNGRIVVAPDHDAAVDAVVTAWAADVAVGRNTVMLAWRRASVAELNRRGREAWRALGRLGDAEVVAPGGTAYAVGDRVVTLAPAAPGNLVTSETTTVVAVDSEARSLVVRADDGRTHTLAGEEIAADRLAHSYALTVHRSQGSTVNTAHALEDGGGRELAYVKMSRARQRSSVYVVADSVEQAVDDLRRDWAAERRMTWAIDSGTPTTEPLAVEADRRVARPMRAALRRARLVAERAAVEAAIPPDPCAEITRLERQRKVVRGQQEHLRAGRERYSGDAPARAAQDLHWAEQRCAVVEDKLSRRGLPRRDRRQLRAEAVEADQRRATAQGRWNEVGQPEVDRLHDAEDKTTERLSDMWDQRQERRSWLDDHPEAERRVDFLDGRDRGPRQRPRYRP